MIALCPVPSPTSPIALTDDISVLNLRIPATNAIRRAGANTIGELITFSALRLYCVRGIGVKTLNDIEAALAEHGLRLRYEPWSIGPPPKGWHGG